MRNAIKVAKWEIKRNVKNKSFIIGIFMTPVIFLIFMLISGLMGSSGDDASVEEETTNVYVNDTIGLYDRLESTAEEYAFRWEMEATDLSEEEMEKELEDSEDTAYIFLNEQTIASGLIPVYTTDDISFSFMNQVQLLESPIKFWQAEELGLSDEELAVVSSPLTFEETTAQDLQESSSGKAEVQEDLMQRIVPGIFGGILLLSIVFTGMYIFQSASLEKKDKIAEIILSSVTPGELMQGKIIGYFILGLLQSAVLLVFAVPFAMWKLDFPVLEYLLVPQTLLFIVIAILGYLLFASLFVGIGATLEDVSTSGNFQSLVMMLPFLPFIFMGPVFSNPDGLIAQIGTYIPFTTPGVLMMRLAMLEEWPWVEIIIALAILIVSIWVFMKLAGKIFQVGILMYGKNATPKEIWRWLRA